MERSTGPDRSKDTPAKVPNTSKGLSESLEDAPVAPREANVVLPPPAPAPAPTLTDRTLTVKIERGADAAYRTLFAYKQYSGGETEDVEANTKSLLTDLMHLSKDYSFTVEDILREALEAYNSEREVEASN